MRKRRCEHRNVLCKTLVDICESSIKVADSIVSLVTKVQVVGVPNESRAEHQSKLTLQKSDQTVDESGWNCDSQPQPKHENELPGIFLHYCFYDLSIQLGDIN